MALVKIIPPQNHGGKVHLAQGVKVIDVESGAEISEVREIEVRFAFNEVVSATINLNVAMDEAVAEAVFLFPSTGGELKEVTEITFVDGTKRLLREPPRAHEEGMAEIEDSIRKGARRSDHRFRL